MNQTTDATTTRPRRRGLGRGLDALLGGPLPAVELVGQPDREVSVGGDDSPALLEIDPTAISPNPEQPRSVFDPAELEALAESIRLHGVLHPIVVERLGDGRYQLVAGERRWRASQMAGVALIPAIVRPATESARHALELALTENLVRSDLSPLEEAAAYSRLADTFGLTHEAIALRVGSSRPQVTNTIRLLNLPAAVQTALAEGRISSGHARALLSLPTPELQEQFAALIESRELNVRDTEKVIASRNNPESQTAPAVVAAKPQLTPQDEALRRGFESVFGTPVRLERTKSGGRVVIEFFADEDLDAIYERIGGRPL